MGGVVAGHGRRYRSLRCLHIDNYTCLEHSSLSEKQNMLFQAIQSPCQLWITKIYLWWDCICGACNREYAFKFNSGHGFPQALQGQSRWTFTTSEYTVQRNIVFVPFIACKPFKYPSSHNLAYRCSRVSPGSLIGSLGLHYSLHCVFSDYSCLWTSGFSIILCNVASYAMPSSHWWGKYVFFLGSTISDWKWGLTGPNTPYSKRNSLYVES